MLAEPLSRLSWHLRGHPSEPLPAGLAVSLAQYLADAEHHGHTTAARLSRQRAMRENLRELAALLSPGACAWAQAGAIADALQGFAVAYRRVQSGHRELRGDTEPRLYAALRDGAPRTQRRIYVALATDANRPCSVSDGAPTLAP